MNVGRSSFLIQISASFKFTVKTQPEITKDEGSLFMLGGGCDFLTQPCWFIKTVKLQLNNNSL